MIKAKQAGKKNNRSSCLPALRRGWLIALVLIFLFVPAPAQAEEINLNILDLKTEAFPLIKVVFDLSNPGENIYELQQGQVTVRENGSPAAILDFSNRVEDDATLALVLCLDISGSMRSGIAEALEAAAGFLQHLGENDNVALIAFGREVYLLHDFTTDKDKLVEVLQSEPQLEGATVFYDSLKEAIILLSGMDGVYRTIVALTDGEENSSVTSLAEIITLAQQENVRIFNIGLLTPDLDPGLLKYISAQTGAKAVIAPTRHQLGDVYNSVAGMLRRFYTLVYRSKAAPGEEIEISLTAAVVDRLITAKEFAWAPEPAAGEVQAAAAAAAAPPVAGRQASMSLLKQLQAVFGVLLLILVGLLLLLRRRRPKVLEVPEQYISVQEAIDAAGSGDVIVVSPGVYNENLDFGEKTITVRSKEAKNANIVARTIIKGYGSDSVVKFGEKSKAVLDGFTITNGSAVRGGGIYVFRRSHPTIVRNVIKGNSSTVEGGGIYIGLCCRPRLEHNTICTNTSRQGGGIFIGDNSNGYYFKNKICNNSAEYGGGVGIAFGSLPTLRENQILNNGAVHDGGGVDICYLSQAVLIKNSISGNNAAYGGGVNICSSEKKRKSRETILKRNNLLNNHPENVYYYI